MSKRKAHQRTLSRARARRQAQRRSEARRRRLFTLGSAALATVLIGALVAAVVPTLRRSPSVAEPSPTPTATRVACGVEPPAAADTDKEQYAAPPKMRIDPSSTDYRATIATSCGDLEIDLYEHRSPRTANNFVFLARENFYAGTTFHRVVPGFVIQGGDPAGTGSGGPGYQFEDELEVARKDGYTPGTVAMANSGANTNGSQFFIVLEGGGAQLSPLYSVLGTVVRGMDVAERIAKIGKDAADRPTETVYIEDVTIHESRE